MRDIDLKFKHLVGMIAHSQEQVVQTYRKTTATFYECERASGMMIDISDRADKALVSLDNITAALSSAENGRLATGPLLASEIREDFAQPPYRNTQMHHEFKEQLASPIYLATPKAKQVMEQYRTPEKTRQVLAGGQIFRSPSSFLYMTLTLH